MAIYYESYQGCQTAEGEFILHYRTKGSKNGQRLYQNKDGSLTPLGREHYGVGKPRNKAKTDEKTSKRAENAGVRQQFGLTEHGRKWAKENGTEKYWDNNTKKEAKEMRAHKAKTEEKTSNGHRSDEPSDDDITAFFDDKETHEKYTTQVAKEKWNEASDALKKAWGSLDGAKEQYRYSADVFEKYWKAKTDEKTLKRAAGLEQAKSDEEHWNAANVLGTILDASLGAYKSKDKDLRTADRNYKDADEKYRTAIRNFRKENPYPTYPEELGSQYVQGGGILTKYKYYRAHNKWVKEKNANDEKLKSDPSIKSAATALDKAEKEYASRLLKSLGYEDTDENRKSVKRMLDYL